MADSIYSVEWWRRYLSGLRSEFAELTMNILLAGGESGAPGSTERGIRDARFCG